MNCLNLVSYDLFFVRVKMSYYWLNRQELSTKVRDRHHNGGGKKKLLNIITKTERFQEKKEEIVRKRKRRKKRTSNRKLRHEY